MNLNRHNIETYNRTIRRYLMYITFCFILFAVTDSKYYTPKEVKQFLLLDDSNETSSLSGEESIWEEKVKRGNESDQREEYLTSTGSICKKNYQALLAADTKPWKDFRHYAAAVNPKLSRVIPGIERTGFGNHEVCKNMTMQGVCRAGNYMLISAYCKSKVHKSVIYVLDEKGKYRKTININKYSHLGALSYNSEEDNVYLAVGNSVFALSMAEIKRGLHSVEDTVLVNPAFIFSLSGADIKNIAFLLCYGRCIFIGTFDEGDSFKNYMYTCSYEGEILSRTNLPIKSQGVCIVDNYKGSTFLVCSTSFGRGNKSKLFIMRLARDVNGQVLIPSDAETGVGVGYLDTPNMSEDLENYGGHILQGFESAASTYREGARVKGVDVSLDRVMDLSVPRLMLNATYLSIEKDTEIKEAPQEHLLQKQKEFQKNAQEVMAEGSCGDNIYWTVYKDGSMYISGKGDMESYGYLKKTETLDESSGLNDSKSQDKEKERAALPAPPWRKYRYYVKKLYIGSEITRIGSGAFAGFEHLKLVNYSDFAEEGRMLEIEDEAFYDCPELQTMSIPDIACLISPEAFDADTNMRMLSDSGSVMTYCRIHGIMLHKHEYAFVERCHATCALSGYDLFQCYCGEKQYRNSSDATGNHRFVIEEVGESSEVYACEFCGAPLVKSSGMMKLPVFFLW